MKHFTIPDLAPLRFSWYTRLPFELWIPLKQYVYQRDGGACPRVAIAACPAPTPDIGITLLSCTYRAILSSKLPRGVGTAGRWLCPDKGAQRLQALRAGQSASPSSRPSAQHANTDQPSATTAARA